VFILITANKICTESDKITIKKDTFFENYFQMQINKPPAQHFEAIDLLRGLTAIVVAFQQLFSA
jgi:hypothetical protein